MFPLSGTSANIRLLECQLTCHAQCAHLVPDFCGMSMEVANRILSEIGKTKRNGPSTSGSMANRTLRAAHSTPTSARPVSMQSVGSDSYGETSPQEQRRTSSIQSSITTPVVQSPASSISQQPPV